MRNDAEIRRKEQNMLNGKEERKHATALIDIGQYFPDNTMCESSSVIQTHTGWMHPEQYSVY
jgi:hypothetical protein